MIRYLEDFEPGQKFGSGELSVEATRIKSFAAEFDPGKPVKLKGTVTEMEWVNPHSWIHIDVKAPDGKVVNWMIEGGSCWNRWGCCSVPKMSASVSGTPGPVSEFRPTRNLSEKSKRFVEGLAGFIHKSNGCAARHKPRGSGKESPCLSC